MNRIRSFLYLNSLELTTMIMDLAEDQVHSAEGLVCVSYRLCPQGDTSPYAPIAFVVYEFLCFLYVLLMFAATLGGK